jgi:hypothetical protein
LIVFVLNEDGALRNSETCSVVPINRKLSQMQICELIIEKLMSNERMNDVLYGYAASVF